MKKDRKNVISAEMEEGRRPTGISAEIPEPEVSAYQPRRYLTENYKRQVVEKVAQLRAEDSGQIGAYLRGEGLYYANVRKWAQKYSAQGQLNTIKSDKPKNSLKSLKDENKRLKQELEKTRRKLAKTEMIVDIQKKISLILEAENSDGQTTVKKES